MLHYKLQAGCLILTIYIIFVYAYECSLLKKRWKPELFDLLLVTGVIYYIADIVTVYTVNHLDTVSDFVNRFWHLVYLVSIDLNIFLLFLYMLTITEGIPKKGKTRAILYAPLIASIFIIFLNIENLEFRHGKITNYSMGASAYTCYGMMAIYVLAAIIVFIKRWKYIRKEKQLSIAGFLVTLAGIGIFQMLVPESLVSSLVIMVNILGIYVNMESPAQKELENYHKETVLGFANLVESRDGSTGLHVKRTTRYVEVIAKELREKKIYTEILTRDYIENLLRAAPLHDIGKIATPDAILKKPGRLTAEEFEEIKKHPANGEEIIKNSLGNMMGGDRHYLNIACQVAKSHHEKWDGTGYPLGLKGEEIPLCARIMAVADVFDAVSENRCYRKAMTMEESFRIIEEGIGSSFDPIVAGAFLDAREEVIKIHDNI